MWSGDFPTEDFAPDLGHGLVIDLRDLPDLPMLRKAGYPMAVADAVAEVRQAAAFVTTRAGGHGAVREAVEHLLTAKGRWHEAVELFG